MSKIDGGLRPLFRAHLPQFDWTSIESGATGGGIPDSNFCSRGIEGWIEYKQTPGYTVTLQPEQIGWIARRVRHGGRVWVAVRRRAAAGPRRGGPCDELHLFKGKHVKVARSTGLRGAWAADAVHVWHNGPTAGWDWQAVAALLVA